LIVFGGSDSTSQTILNEEVMIMACGKKCGTKKAVKKKATKKK
jgi:hypothetical protein